jgi:hypothetical protein
LPENRRLPAEEVWKHESDRDGDPWVGTLVTEKSWQEWLERLYRLWRDKRGPHERPHKPVLLLSILDVLDRGVIAGNRVPLSGVRISTTA